MHLHEKNELTFEVKDSSTALQDMLTLSADSVFDYIFKNRSH